MTAMSLTSLCKVYRIRLNQAKFGVGADTCAVTNTRPITLETVAETYLKYGPILFHLKQNRTQPDDTPGGVGRDSSVGTATRYGLDGPGIESRLRRDFPHLSRPTHRPTQTPVVGSFLGIKRPCHGVDHTHPIQCRG